MTQDDPTHAPITSITKAVEPQRRAETVALGDAIAELAARIQAATYELLVMIREFDERDGWGRGFSSCAHWLNWRTGLALGAAREKVRVARALGELPRLSEAMRLGSISYSKIRAITRVATPATEERLLDFARCATASHVERLGFSCRGVRLNSVASSVTARLAASSSRLVRRTPEQRCFLGHSPPGCFLVAPCQTNASTGKPMATVLQHLGGARPAIAMWSRS